MRCRMERGMLDGCTRESEEGERRDVKAIAREEGRAETSKGYTRENDRGRKEQGLLVKQTDSNGSRRDQDKAPHNKKKKNVEERRRR